MEVRERIDRVDDAVRAAKCALDEGIVAGGGVTLLKISEEMISLIVDETDGELAGELAVIDACCAPIEKMCESLTYRQFIYVTSRMDYLSSHINNLGCALNVEKGLQIEVPELAKVVRTILCELTRIASHELWLGAMAMDLGAATAGHWSGAHAVQWDINAPPFGDLSVGDQFQKHNYPFGVLLNARGERFEIGRAHV